MIVNFSCPNCGADMSYDIKLGKLHCDHCDHSEDIQPDGESYKNAAGEPADKPRYCVNCGGLLSTGAKTCATHCEYCDVSSSGCGGPEKRIGTAGVVA